MNFSRIKYYSLALAPILVLGIGCNSSDPRDGAGPETPPIKDIPVVTEPVVKYNFYEPKTEEGLQNDTNYGYLIAKARPGFKTAHFERMGFKVIGGMAANGAVYYRLYKESDVLSALNHAKKYAGLMFIEPEIKHELYAVETNPITFNNLDQFLADKSAFASYTIKAYDAWRQYGFGSSEKRPVVASVDSGIRWSHEDLISQVKHVYSWFTPTSNTNWTTYVQLEGLDGERFMDLLPDFTLNYNGTKYYNTDQNGHGTHTSGTIVATGNNGVGMAGVSWNNDLIQYKAFASNGGASDWSLYGSIWHLARWKEANSYTATIPVNYSLGSPYASQFSLDMVSHGLQNGIVMVAATGNDGQRMVKYPTAYPGVIAVGATTGADKLASFSCWGPHLSVVAPGENILSTLAGANDNYGWGNGTSMAAPHVTGLIGYMLNFNPDLKPDQIKTYIEQNADYIDGQTGFSDKYGWGRINVLKTIEAVINDANNGATPPSTYVLAPVKIKAPMNGLNVFLYNCSADGTIENYVGSSITGDYLADLDPDTGQGRESNIAWFNMLRPGRYIAKAYVGPAKKVASTEPFNVETNMAPLEAVLGFNAEMLTIQTFPTWDIFTQYGGGSGAYVDPEIWVYDTSAGDPNDEDAAYHYYDYYVYDAAMIVMPDAPGAYWIRITNYDQRVAGEDYGGEYSLYVTRGAPYVGQYSIDGGDGGPPWTLPPVVGDPGGAGPFGKFATGYGGVIGAQATTFANAPIISFNTIYYGAFSGSDYNAPGSTNGATGHYYRFIVE
ncbi:MAG: S8 family serine peptidase [Holophagales bacterium]|jgi:hypothetical protein|nr:S8 family serine peptidase [Holophagales bacterium]